MSEKKGPSCPNWGHGGGFRWFGQCPKENVFFNWGLPLHCNIHTSLQRWRHASTSSWTTSGVGSRVQSSVMTGQGQAGMMTKMGHLTIAQIAWESTWDRKLPRRRDQITFGLTATAGFSCFFDQHQLHLIRNAADQEALAGKITYYPASRALPLSYFPFLVQPWSSFVIWGQQNAWSGSQEPKGTKRSWP